MFNLYIIIQGKKKASGLMDQSLPYFCKVIKLDFYQSCKYAECVYIAEMSLYGCLIFHGIMLVIPDLKCCLFKSCNFLCEDFILKVLHLLQKG